MTRALGRYELLRPIARGGMAEVFLARRRVGGIEKLLVVKRIRPERAGDARFLELFVREARLSMSLAHQNIVPVFDFGRAGEQVFLAMERVEGKDLSASLARAGEARPLAAQVAAFIAAECCQALDYAHRRTGERGDRLGVVHRDVTPRNVLLSWSGEVKLTDFGIAALAGEDTSRLVGTPAYMAPEQARGEAVDARADVYAVGLVLREAMTGVRGRTGRDRDAMIAAARTNELSPWPAGDHPAELVAVADRATAAVPDDRYPDAQAMLADLDTFLVSARAAQRGESPARQLAAWLAAVWDGAREEPADAQALPAGELMSFLDDAEERGAGTGTERSLAATVGTSQDGPMLERPAAGPPADATRAPPPPPARSRQVRRVATGLGATLAIALGSVVVVRNFGRHGARTAATVQADAVVARAVAPADRSDDTPPDARPGPPLDTPPDARPDPAVDATRLAPLDAGTRAIRTAPHPAQPLSRPDAGTTATGATAATAVTAATAATRKVRVNAVPWATFTVDGDPTARTTISTVELAPGPHRLRFTNPQLKVSRDVTIVVPADHDIDHVEDLRRAP